MWLASRLRLAALLALVAWLSSSLSLVTSDYTQAALRDKVRSLPGYSNRNGTSELDFALFSGLITVKDGGAKYAFWYGFVEVTNDTKKLAPLVLWYSGDCSAARDLLLGSGPLLLRLRPSSQNSSSLPFTFTRSNYSWTQHVNMLYVDSNINTGYSRNATKKARGGRVLEAGTEAAQLLSFLKSFYQRFPRYLGHRLMLGGSGVAGQVLPHLARLIYQQRLDEEWRLSGLFINNPLTDYPAVDLPASVDFYTTAAMMSPSRGSKIKAACVGNATRVQSAACRNALLEYAISNSVPVKVANSSKVVPTNPGATVLFNEKWVFQDMCPEYNDTLAIGVTTPDCLYTQNRMGSGLPNLSPCQEELLEVYLNTRVVRNALNVGGASVRKWRACSIVDRAPPVLQGAMPFLQYNDTARLASVTPVYRELLKHRDLRIWIMSGELDSTLPLTGTRRWAAGLGLPLKEPPDRSGNWSRWFTDNGGLNENWPNAGWAAYYEGLTYALVWGGGRNLAETQPERTEYLLRSFLANKAFLAEGPDEADPDGGFADR